VPTSPPRRAQRLDRRPGRSQSCAESACRQMPRAGSDLRSSTQAPRQLFIRRSPEERAARRPSSTISANPRFGSATTGRRLPSPDADIAEVSHNDGSTNTSPLPYGERPMRAANRQSSERARRSGRRDRGKSSPARDVGAEIEVRSRRRGRRDVRPKTRGSARAERLNNLFLFLF